MARHTRIAGSLLAGIMALTALGAPAVLAAKPPPPGPMTATCTVSGVIATGYAFGVPKGTRMVGFTFYKDEADVTAEFPSGPNGEVDTNKRDGWSGWGEANPPAGWTHAPRWLVVEAMDGKARVLATVAVPCPSS